MKHMLLSLRTAWCKAIEYMRQSIQNQKQCVPKIHLIKQNEQKSFITCPLKSALSPTLLATPCVFSHPFLGSLTCPWTVLAHFLYFDLDSLVTNAMTEYKRAMNTWALEALAWGHLGSRPNLFESGHLGSKPSLVEIVSLLTLWHGKPLGPN